MARTKKIKPETDVKNADQLNRSGRTNSNYRPRRAKQTKEWLWRSRNFSTSWNHPVEAPLFDTKHNATSWSYDIHGHAQKGTKQQIRYTKYPHHAWMTTSSKTGRIENSRRTVCSLQIAETLLHLARIGRPDILWTLHCLARHVTNWNRACDKRSARPIRYIHHAENCRQNCHVGNNASDCQLGLFQEAEFAEDLRDSMSTAGGVLCIFGSQTLCQLHGHARTRLQCHRAAQKRK